MPNSQTVFIVDDSAVVRRSLGEFLRAAQLRVMEFPSAKEFLSYYRPTMSGCLILDLAMPEMGGLELQEKLCANEECLPIIVVSGHAAIRDAVKSMKLGSFEFIEKPFSTDFLLGRVKEALLFDRHNRSARFEKVELRARFQKLSAREREIAMAVIAGKTSKSIASEMGLSVSTVDNHRANVMKKLKAETSADLTRMALLVDPTLAFPARK